MKVLLRIAILGLLLPLSFARFASASAYDGQPKLVVVIVIDQFRGDYLERYRSQFGNGGFRLLLDHGADFTDCYYNYANTVTAAGHATLFTGAYSNGHGIPGNEWWDPQQQKIVTSVEDAATKVVGVAGDGPGASPHNLLADTIGDELKLATQGKSRVFGIALKDRAAILPAGFSADGAYWIDRKSGAWVTSTFYRNELPKWVQNFNDSKRADKYLNREWKDSSGKVLMTTSPEPGEQSNFFDLVGPTPFGNEYELEFARELITYEKLGAGPATDLLTISLSPNDLLGHKVGPDAPEMAAMALALDRELAGFFDFLGHEIGLANVWIALSADHGVAPTAAITEKLRIPSQVFAVAKVKAGLNRILTEQLSPGHPADYVEDFGPSIAWLNDKAFLAVNVKEEDAERDAGEALKQIGMRDYYTRSRLARGDTPNTETGLRFAHSYAPAGGWYVMAVLPEFAHTSEKGGDHGAPYSYDTHVPLAFFGIPFQPGTYHTHAEPVDLAVTLASLLRINQPTSAVGRVLTEALANLHPPAASAPTSATGGGKP